MGEAEVRPTQMLCYQAGRKKMSYGDRKILPGVTKKFSIFHGMFKTYGNEGLVQL